MLLQCGIEISGAKASLNWLRKWAMVMWEVANCKILVLLFTSRYREFIKSYSSMKLTRNNPFRLHLVLKNIWLEKSNGTIFESK